MHANLWFTTGGIDFSATILMATFNTNVTMITVDVPIITDITFEEDEQFLLTLSVLESIGIMVDGTGTATANIINAICEFCHATYNW